MEEHFSIDNIQPIFDAEPTESMKKPHTAEPFKALRQTLPWARYIYDKSFAEMMKEYKDDYVVWARKMQRLFDE